MDKQDIIYDLVKGIKSDQDDIKDDIVEIKSNLKVHSISLERYNDLLNIHIAGVDTLKKLHLDNAKRIEMLEEPVKADAAVSDHHKKMWKLIFKIGSAVLAIGGLWVAWKGLK